MSDLPSPITVEFDGQTRACFARQVETDLAQRPIERNKTRLKVRTAAEAQALLSTFETMELLSFDPQQIPVLHRVRDELVAGLEERGYAVEDGEIREQELVTDGGVPENFEELASTCETCGETVDPQYLEDGECPGCVYGEPVADGGVTWTELTGFKRDCLEAIRRLENDGETTYGLAIKAELERLYSEDVNHGQLYPNLDDLVEYGLVEKGELDKRTNKYELTTEAESMLDRRARLFADACGMEQPVADGGDSA